MNYNQYTTEELQKRLDIIKELKTLEGDTPAEPKKADAPWYPNVKWVEYNPSMVIDRNKVIEVLVESERESKWWEKTSLGSEDFSEEFWDRKIFQKSFGIVRFTGRQ